MAYPLIGIATRGEDGHQRYALSARYIASVRHAGGLPVLLPPGEPEVERILKRLEGMILPGGGDVAPALYQGRSGETIYGVDPKRDETEIRIVKYALLHGLPLLGICRGIQIMNVAMGGTLIEHLPDVVGDKVKHRGGEDEAEGACCHPVRLCSDSRFAAIFESTDMDVPSSHHQAIRQLASPLVAFAHADDGVIEAVAMDAHPFFIGVQWHPELSDDPRQQKLFRALIHAASRPRVS